jgi:hypothetical protein
MHTSRVAGIPVLWAEAGGMAERKRGIWLPGFTGGKENVEENTVSLIIFLVRSTNGHRPAVHAPKRRPG